MRRSVVLRALQWLKKKPQIQKYDALDQLPEDGDLTGLSSVMLKLSIDEDERPTGEIDGASSTSSFVPLLDSKQTEEEIIKRSMEERQTTLPWPSASKVPINEFRTARLHFLCISYPVPDG